MSTTQERLQTLLGVDPGFSTCTGSGTPLLRSASRSYDGIGPSNAQGHLPATRKRAAIGPGLPTDLGKSFVSGPELCSDPLNKQVALAHLRQPPRPRTRVSEICFCVENSMGREMYETGNKNV